MTEIPLARPKDEAALPPAPDELERRARQYAYIDEKLAAERQADLDEVFHIDPTFALNNPQEAEALKAQFLEEKKGLNLGECFALSLRDPYFGRVYVVKLASTDHSEPDSSQRLFRETNDFLHWLKTEGPLVGLRPYGENGHHISETMGNDEVTAAIAQQEDPGNHIDRLKSGRWMEYEFVDDEDGNPMHRLAVIRRIRPFVNVEAEIRGEMCNVKMYKETVFTIPAHLLDDLLLRNRLFSRTIVEQENEMADITSRQDMLGRSHHVFPEAVQYDPNPISYTAMQVIESWLYTTSGDDPRVQRHRNHTAIYSAVVPHAVDQRIMEQHES